MEVLKIATPGTEVFIKDKYQQLIMKTLWDIISRQNRNSMIGIDISLHLWNMQICICLFPNNISNFR